MKKQKLTKLQLYKTLRKVCCQRKSLRLLRSVQPLFTFTDTYTLSGAFVWEDTKQGIEFWSNLNRITAECRDL